MTTVALFSGGVLFLIFGLGFLSSYLGKHKMTKTVVIAYNEASCAARRESGELRVGTPTPNRATSSGVSLGETALRGFPANPVGEQVSASSGDRK